MGVEVKIGSKAVGPENQVFVIAELGINHNGDMNTARRLIEEAAAARAGAVKLQTYITEKRVPADSPIFGILKQCELSFEQQRELFKYAGELGMEVFSTPFDDESVDFLDGIGVSAFKIASFDIVNQRLLRKVASCGKPVVMSRGMATDAELDSAVEIIRGQTNQLLLLHCVSAYPVKDHRALNLSMIAELHSRYGVPAGFSDHTMGVEAALYAVAAGAVALEKHFTLSRQAEGPDHALSCEPDELRKLVDGANRVQEMLGSPVSGAVDAERDILQYRRETK
jgi:sialic acid synthase SpsE